MSAFIEFVECGNGAPAERRRLENAENISAIFPPSEEKGEPEVTVLLMSGEHVQVEGAYETIRNAMIAAGIQVAYAHEDLGLPG